MLLIFLRHQWKSFLRSRNKAGNIIARIILGIFIIYFLAIAVAAGFFMEKLLHNISPDKNVIQVFNGLILYYFMADFLERIQFQELPTISIVPYLHLNISKNKIVNFLNTKALFSAFNLIPLLVFLPFCTTRIASSYGGFATIMYAVSIVSIVVFNNYLALYIKRKSISNVLYAAIGIAVIIFFAGLEYFKIISIAAASNVVFTQIAKHPFAGFGFTILAILIYKINSIYLRKNLYTEELSIKIEKKGSTDYPFLNGFGKVGELADLELKLIIRNKRPRTTILYSFIFLFYGLIFYKESILNKNEFGMYLTVAVFMTGFSIISYGQFMFAWQSAHFDGLLANKINFKNFIKAKFLLFTITCSVIALLSFLYGFISWKLLLLHFVAYLYNIGFGAVIILYFASMNYKRLDISKSSKFNWQGTSAVQWISTFPIILLPFFIFWPFNYFHKPFWGIAAVGIFGLITLLMRNFWVDHLTKKLEKQRYKIAAGFREKL